jgi:hypothetical protein
MGARVLRQAAGSAEWTGKRNAGAGPPNVGASAGRRIQAPLSGDTERENCFRPVTKFMTQLIQKIAHSATFFLQKQLMQYT